MLRLRRQRFMVRVMVNQEQVKASLLDSLKAADTRETPYRHWILKDIFPEEALEELQHLEFPVGELEGVSGRRELHNDTRQYFDKQNNERFDVCGAVAEAFQSPEVVAAIEEKMGADLEGTYLRIEYAQDTDGFWLEPHTDIGVKRFTMLYYVSDGPGHEELGTDIYADKETHAARSPFAPNLALIFVPSNATWHGFEKRPIEGVRKSVIINYVTNDWRAREQLAFPEAPVKAA